MNIEKIINEKTTAILDPEIKNLLCMLYHENTKLNTFTSRALGEKIGAFFGNIYLIERANTPFKRYDDKKQIDLTIYKNNIPNSNTSFFDLISQRKSIRQFDINVQISLYELFVILHFSYGVLEKEEIKGYPFKTFLHRKSVPSGGGLYPLELYVIVLQGQMKSGLYHFRSDECCLEVLAEQDYLDAMKKISGADTVINLEEANAIVITTSMFQRNLTKYGDRGYRFIMHEVGAVSMMMSLLCEYLNLGSCILGGYLDDEVNSILGIDGFNESIVNIMVVGGKNNKQ